MDCSSTDFMYPMCAEVYTPIIQQSAYGNVAKQWMVDRKIACSFTPAGSAFKEEVAPNVDITKDMVLVGRAKHDLRISSLEKLNSMMNVVITNIRDQNGDIIYLETSGPRSGLSTIFEIATIQPFVNPFGTVDHYKIVIRRSENQGVGV